MGEAEAKNGKMRSCIAGKEIDGEWKEESGRMRVAAEENRREEESQRSEEAGREAHEWSERGREEILFQDHTY